MKLKKFQFPTETSVQVDFNSAFDKEGERIVFSTSESLMGPVPVVGQVVTIFQGDDGVYTSARLDEIVPSTEGDFEVYTFTILGNVYEYLTFSDIIDYENGE